MFFKRTAVLLCLLTFSGCAFFPVQPTPSYLKDLYKRMPYVTEGRYRVVNIFFASTREVEEKKSGSFSYTPKLSGNTAYGALDVKVNPVLKIGKMLPNRLKRSGKVGIEKVNRLDSAEFTKELKATVDASPHQSLLVTIFGYKDGFEVTAIKAAYFAYSLDVNTPVLMFDWPGDQPVSIAGYEKARAMANASGPYLGELLAKIIREVRPKRLWVKSSSLGCQVVCSAFEHMYKYDDLADSELEIDHVVLAAPDVIKNEFNDCFKDELAALARKLTTYVSSDDEALLLSGMLDGEERLGRVKQIRIKDPEQLEEVKNLLYIKAQHPDRVALVDVTLVNEASFKHGYYLETPAFFDDLYLRLFDQKPSANRRLYLLTTKDKVDYWVLRGDK